MMQIRYSKNALKFLSRQDMKLVERLRKGIEGLTHSPPQGDIKPLQGFDDGRMRLRIGAYRVIFRYGNEGQLVVLLILDIGSRGGVYK